MAVRAKDRDDEHPGWAFQFTSPVDISQLSDELAAAGPRPDLVAEGRPSEASDTAPLIVWVDVESPDSIAGIIKKHSPIEDESEDTSKDEAMQAELAEVESIKKLLSKDELSDEDRDRALRFLLERVI